MRTLLVIVLLAAPAHAAKSHASKTRELSRAQVHDKAMAAYQSLDFKQAADLFAREVAMLRPAERGTDVELQARQRLVLALYQTSRKNDSLTEYHAMRERFPTFRFNEDEVLPETIEFFEKAAPPKPDVVAKQNDPLKKDSPAKVTPDSPKQIIVSPDSPRVLTQPPPDVASAPVKRWHWYYLAPFGIGQFLAGSPVRGTIFAVLQAGLVAADIALYVRLNQVATQSGNELRTTQPQLTGDLQIALNVVFFSMIGSFIAGFIDGFLEP